MIWNEEVPYRNHLNDETQMRFSGDPTQYVLSKPLETNPGSSFSSGNFEEEFGLSKY